MSIIIFLLLACLLADNDKSTATTRHTDAPHATSINTQAEEQRARTAENARIMAQRQREFWEQRQRDINLHNALVQQNRMTPGTSTSSCTYWY